MVISRLRWTERKRKEMYRNEKKKARQGRAKLLFLYLKYANKIRVAAVATLIFLIMICDPGSSLLILSLE